MRKVSYTQTNTGTWAADNAGIAVDIDRTGLITRIDATVEITPSLTLDGANQPDGIFRLIQNLRVLGGSHTYFTLPADDACLGGILLHNLNVKDGFGLGHRDADIAAPGRLYVPMNFVFHAGSRPQDIFGRDNPFDLSAFIPANMENQLRAEWVTAGNDVMDDSVTVSSAVLRLTLHMVQGTEAEIRAEMARQGVQVVNGAPNGMIPAWSSEVYAHTATATDYSTERDVPLGGFLKRIILANQDATATRSLHPDDEVTGMALKLPYQNETLFRCYTDHMMGHMPLPASSIEADEAAIDFGIHNIEGFFVLDCRPHSVQHPDYGLDLRGLQTGQVKLGLTITTYASGDDSLILYERYVANPNSRLAPG